jgi:3-hydroxyisobutyrate dehydrogenase-like beta-hydroxyacid dehydrogenase
MTDERHRIAVLGTGLMGAPMARRLLDAGHRVTAWNRTREKLAPLAAAGATLAAEPADAVAEADAVVLMLSDAAAIREALVAAMGPDLLAGRTILQMGTIAPEESRELAARTEAAGGGYLEAPVLGSVPQATDGSLLVMAGGDSERFERWRPVLEVMGAQVRLVGPVGAAATLKLAFNQVIAALSTGYATSLGLVRRAGIDLDDFADILRASPFYAPTFDKKLGGILEGRFEPANFPARHLLKDVRLIRAEAERLGLGADHLAGIETILERTVEAGRGGEDYSSLATAVDPRD